jgi:hypothetical protein
MQIPVATFSYKVNSFQSNRTIFRKCGTCQGKVIPVISNAYANQDERFFCEKCNVIITTTTELKCNFKLELGVYDLERHVFESVVAFDDVAEKFMGCTAAENIKVTKV